MPEIEAIATAMLEELEAAGTVRVVPTARAARLTMDREGIRRLAVETLGLPVNTALKSPGASAVIYGSVDAAGIVFDGVADALQVPNTDIRLFGKPESFVKRRMGVALAFAGDVELTRSRAQLAASKVKPRVA